MCEVCSKLTIKTPECCLLLAYFTPFSIVSFVDFEQVNALKKYIMTEGSL